MMTIPWITIVRTWIWFSHTGNTLKNYKFISLLKILDKELLIWWHNQFDSEISYNDYKIYQVTLNLYFLESIYPFSNYLSINSGLSKVFE